MAEREIRVAIDEWAEDTEVVAIEEVFRDVGLDAEVEASFGVRSLDAPSWHVVIELTSQGIDWLLAGIVGQAGIQGAKKLRELIERTRATRKESPAEAGTIVIIDAKGNWVVFGDLPDEAYDKLLAESWQDLEGGYLLWDKERRKWIDHTGNRRER